jgi:hypothetical protein
LCSPFAVLRASGSGRTPFAASDTLRKCDGTAVIRFEVPNRYGHLSLLELRFAAWNLAPGPFQPLSPPQQ